LCRIIDFAALFVFKDLTAFSFRRFRSMRFPCPERAEIWRSTPPRVMPAKAASTRLCEIWIPAYERVKELALSLGL
jgi:hypothetical protein